MEIRAYNPLTDSASLQSWVCSEREHALWCANRIPYPLSSEGLQEALDKEKQQWGGNAWTAVNEEKQPIGFFVLSVNETNHSGHLKFVIVDRHKRGRGYGTQMIALIREHAFQMLNLSSLQLNVFDSNKPAIQCYWQAGFTEETTAQQVFVFGQEKWGRCHMVLLNQ